MLAGAREAQNTDAKVGSGSEAETKKKQRRSRRGRQASERGRSDAVRFNYVSASFGFDLKKRDKGRAFRLINGRSLLR